VPRSRDWGFKRMEINEQYRTKLWFDPINAADAARDAKTLVRYGVRSFYDEGHHLIPETGPNLNWLSGRLRSQMDALRTRATKVGIDLNGAENGVSLTKGWHQQNTLSAKYYQRVLDHFKDAATKQDFVAKLNKLAEELLKESGKLK
jgi:hypothetical protein